MGRLSSKIKEFFSSRKCEYSSESKSIGHIDKSQNSLIWSIEDVSVTKHKNSLSTNKYGPTSTTSTSPTRANIISSIPISSDSAVDKFIMGCELSPFPSPVKEQVIFGEYLHKTNLQTRYLLVNESYENIVPHLERFFRVLIKNFTEVYPSAWEIFSTEHILRKVLMMIFYSIIKTARGEDSEKSVLNEILHNQSILDMEFVSFQKLEQSVLTTMSQFLGNETFCHEVRQSWRDSFRDITSAVIRAQLSRNAGVPYSITTNEVRVARELSVSIE
mmetsp:Transcript_15116/g.20861  ORF Transcript_15116/g.20861 Transcript_15116/m.20861 type:complete len:274 (+) Transcript_15116:265-1086(+)